MKKTECIFLLLLVLSLYSCIHDDTKFPSKEIPEITNVNVERDTFFNILGVPFKLTPDVSLEPREQDVTYTWKASYMNYYSGVERQDSLKMISCESELNYVFPKLGTYKVRLEVSNGKMMLMKEFRIVVQTVFAQGLFVFSDHAGIGRISFLPLAGEGHVLADSSVNFIQRPVENLNPMMITEGMSDVQQLGAELYVCVSSKNLVYRLDGSTFEEILTYDFAAEWPEKHLTSFMRGTAAYGDSYVMSEEGKVGKCALSMCYIVDDTSFDGIYDKMITWNGKQFGYLDYYYFVLFDKNREYYDAVWEMRGSPDKIARGDAPEGYKVYNGYGYVGESSMFFLISRNKDNLNKFRVDRLQPEYDRDTWTTSFVNKAFKEFEQSDVTLSESSPLLYSTVNNSVYYFDRHDLYLWKGMGYGFPESPVLTLDGEITYMGITENHRYIYLGVWQENAKAVLKGSVYLYEVATNKIVKEYRNIADKPVRIFYKTSN